MDQVETVGEQGVRAGEPAHERFGRRVGEVRERGKALGKLAGALAVLGREGTWADLGGLEKVLERLGKKVAAIGGESALGQEVLASAREELEARRARLREGLGRELKALCDARGLDMRVVSREEPVEVRIAPLAVVIDRQRGKAEVRFARLALETAAADPEAIWAARERALGRLEQGFDPATFFEACRRAWLAARASAGPAPQAERGSPERVELADFLPQLALQFQRPAFRVHPVEKNFIGYPRARFAYDVLRLQRAGQLAQGGWRLNLGVATGTSASKKDRVLWCEDEYGQGEYKLTVFFTQTQNPAAARP